MIVAKVHVAGEDIPPTRVVIKDETEVHPVGLRMYGLPVPLLIQASHFPIPPVPIGEMLEDGRGLALVKVPIHHVYDWIPSERPLYAIMEAVVRHGEDNPTHGSDCICMDDHIREIRVHLYRATPDLERKEPRDDESPDEWSPTQESWDRKYNAVSRIRVVLMALARGMGI